MIRHAAAFARFGVLGGISFALNLAVTTGLHELAGVRAETAYAVALALVLLTNFVACRLWVFGDSHGRALDQGVLFLISSLAFRGAEYAAFLVLHTLAGLHYLAAIVLITAFSVATKFLHYRFVVFRASPASPGGREPASPQRGTPRRASRV